jgi:hypothetical protein
MYILSNVGHVLEKMSNWPRFQADFHLEYFKKSPKVIFFFRLTSQFSMDWELFIWNTCNQKRRRPRKQLDPSVVAQSRLNSTLGWSGFTHTIHSHLQSTFRTPVLYLPHSDLDVLRHTMHNSTLTFIVTASIHTNYQNQTPPSRHSHISLYKSFDSTSSHSSSRLVLPHLNSTLPITLRSEASSG